MLVLSRRPNEKILIPALDIAVQVVAVKSGVVRLGVEAPDNVQVYREEVWDRIGPGPRPQNDVPRSRPRKALLVEDDHNECELLAAYLRMAGIEVDTAGDGGDALDYLRRQGRPDVVLLDMVLPRCDGPATVRAIREDPAYAGLKIFAVTGHSPEKFPTIRAGVDRWFCKPLNPAILVRALSKELGSDSA